MNHGWLQTPLGAALLEAEQRLVQSAMEGIFGEVCVQVGQWGEPDAFIRFARTQRAGVVGPQPDAGISLVSAPDQLGIADDSVDLMLLPHTLDLCEHPHAALREATRVLRSDGQLIVLAFKPGGLWGLKRLWPGSRFPDCAQRVVGERQLSDWLELLDLRVTAKERYFFKWPSDTGAEQTSPVWQQWGERFWPELAACYALRAQKRLRTLIPLRSRWKPRKKVVAGLVKPSIRAVDSQRRVVSLPPSFWKRR
ncbi:MAG: methyltransferase domain-containing protein [Pseudomonadota bacterium]